VQRSAEPGKTTLTGALGAHAGHDQDDRPARSPAEVHQAAAAGIAGPGGAMPHQASIQAAFGRNHDVGGIQAHVGGPAADATAAMGATAFATGNHVAFAARPDLHTAAHEAAHVFQQQQGVQLHGGVGESGDVYERHADAVADRVVAGQSAADLLGASPGTGASSHAVQHTGVGAAVQRNDTTTTKITGATDTGNQYSQELMVDKTSKRVQIQLGIKWVKAGTWASDPVFQTFIRWVKTSVYGYMDNKFKIVCTPNAGGDKIELPIDTLLWDTDDGYQITVHGGTPGGDSLMKQAGGNLYEYDSSNAKEEAITMAHEFGHCLLHASDEYANPAVPGRVLTNDHSIMANYYTQGKAQATFKVRHFQHLTAEVGKQYPGYTLKVEAM
jgi:Domain of unknown function (DUF4157)